MLKFLSKARKKRYIKKKFKIKKRIGKEVKKH